MAVPFWAWAAPKLHANADWMIRQRRAYLKDVPGRDRLWMPGLLPPHNIWDSTNWRLWYESNANYWLGLSHYAEAVADLDAETGRKYAAEAKAYAKGILAAVEKSFALSPVVRVRDGTYRSFLPPIPIICALGISAFITQLTLMRELLSVFLRQRSRSGCGFG